MTNPSKAKGTAAETAVVGWLRTLHWPHAERRALAGTLDKGDILGIPSTVIEVKACKTFDLAGWVTELEAEIRNADADMGAIIAKKRGTTNVDNWYAILPAHLFAQLLREAGR